MNKQDVSLIPPVFVTKPDDRFCSENRKWQSAPSAAISDNGRIFCVYSGDNVSAGETTDNYTICSFSDDDGETFKLAFYAYHKYDVRMSETLLFIDPNGVLYHFWTQSYHYFDGRGGIWCCTCKAPDAEHPVFSEPRRICDGFMADNPTILKNGKWIFPSSVWTHIASEFHPHPDYEKASIWGSDHNEKELTYIGGVKTPVPDFTENTIYEKKDGTLVMLFRTSTAIGGINKSESTDGGKTWSEPVGFALEGPNSRFFVARFPSGTLLVVYHDSKAREKLTAYISYDDGETFPHSLLLDERGDISYPSGNVTKDGRVIIAYDRERVGAEEILLAVFSEEDVKNGKLLPGSYTKKIAAIGGKNGYV